MERDESESQQYHEPPDEQYADPRPVSTHQIHVALYSTEGRTIEHFKGDPQDS